MSSSYRVVVTDFVTGPLDIEKGVLRDLADVEALEATTEEQLSGQIEEAAAIMVYHTVTLSRATIERLRKCRVIVRCGVGYDNVDHAFARIRNIPVANVPDYGTEDVADTAIGMMLALARGIATMNSRLRSDRGPWSYRQVVPLRRLRDAVCGIVGLGRIGTAAAMRAKSLGMDVVFYDPYKPDGYDKALGIRQVTNLDELLREAFVVSLHCPLTEETRHLFDREVLAAMRRGSYLINTARGAVVETAAIPPLIESGHLAGAALDVLPTEPPDADDLLIRAWRDPGHPAHDRLLINPHAAFYCEEAFADMRRKAAQTCRQALLGQPISNVVNRLSVGGP